MILFIHPRTEMTLKEILPMSLPALVNRLRERWDVIGRFHDEWTPDEVKRASLVLFDIHWYLSIPSANRLSHRLKSLNPSVRIAAGGASASVFAPQILRDSAIDYIIRGDAEVPLTLLAEEILENGGRNVERVPNLMTREFESPNWYCLTPDDMNSNNYRDISWFPSLKARTERLHRGSRGRVYSIHPFLSVYRGCPLPCNFCLGSNDRQRKVFRRDWVVRAPEKVREDLIAFSDDANMRFVSVYHDFLTIVPESYAATALDRTYDLDIRIELFRTPTEGQLDLLLRSFKGGKICFSLDQMHATSPALPDISGLIARIRQVQASGRFEAWVSYVAGLVRHDAAYAEAYHRVERETRAPMDRVDAWWDLNPKPDDRGFASEEEYQEACQSANRYRFFNMLFRGSVMAYRHFPKTTAALLRLYSHNNCGSPVKEWQSEKPTPRV